MRIAIEEIFKINDRVYHYKYGWGTIEGIFSGRVIAEFDKTKGLIRELDGDKKLLSFTEYTIENFSQERPEELPKKGDIVWTRNEYPSEWEIGYFFKKEGNTYYTSASKNSQGWRSAGLEITIKNPYENGK